MKYLLKSFCTPPSRQSNFPDFTIAGKLIQDSEAWETEISFMMGELGTGAGGTGGRRWGNRSAGEAEGIPL